jgi:hypothetical protein
MATTKQIQAAQQNVKKAQKAWKDLSSHQRSMRQPDGASRKKPGMGNAGDYYRVIIRPKSEFVTFRTHDVGRKGHTQRIAGKRSSGSWATHSWLIHKDDAFVESGKLQSKKSKIKDVLNRLRGPIKKYKGNIFRAKPRRNIPERDKPTKKQRMAWEKNIKKAQIVRKSNNS